jgi:hypothetical protein
MLQQMTEIILIKTEKTSLNLSKQWNITNYTATADTLLIDEHIASIVKEKNIYLYFHYISRYSSAFQDSQTKGLRSSKPMVCLSIYT